MMMHGPANVKLVKFNWYFIQLFAVPWWYQALYTKICKFGAPRLQR